MKIQLRNTFLILVSALALSACQTSVLQNQTTQTTDLPVAEVILDSDGDGVLDDVDECPKTPNHTVVDVKGCTVIIEGGDALEMEFSGFFLPMSSQLPDIYDVEFTKIEEKLNEYPESTVFVFGHVASNEINNDSLTAFGFESLPRNRALIVKNMLVLDHNIAAERIHIYDCSNKVLGIDTESIDRNFEALNLKNIKSKQSRVTLRASSEVSDLNNLKYVSYSQMYGEYAKQCKQF